MPNPFLIDWLPTQIGVSGGRTSAFLAEMIWEAMGRRPNPEVYFTFQNTGEEVEPTYVFLRDLEKVLEIPIVWLEWWNTFNINDYVTKDGQLSERRLRGQERAFRVVNFDTACRSGEPFDKLLEYYWAYRAAIKPTESMYILPTLVTRMCTSHLKIKTAERFMASVGHKKFNRVVGLRYDEPARWTKRGNDESQLPLVDAKITRKEVNEFWRQQPFNLGLDEESIEGNCRHCFLKTPAKAVAIMKKAMAANGGMVDLELERWLNRERQTGLVFRRDRPTYQQLVQIAQSELMSGTITEFDEALYPDYKCDCAGTDYKDSADI